jgi:hypothetical protein
MNVMNIDFNFEIGIAKSVKQVLPMPLKPFFGS